MTEIIVLRDGGEILCRVCGLTQPKAIWGADGDEPTFETCDCCGCTFGHEDISPDSVRATREKWISDGARWFAPEKRLPQWNLEEQLIKIPRFYFRVLPGLPATGAPAISFDESGASRHSEGFVVEFTCADGGAWVGNFRSGYFGKSAVLMFLGSARRALVVANGAAYVIEPETQKLIRHFGGGITDVLYLPDRDTMIFSDGIYLERLDADGIKWRTRRISWDGISKSRDREWRNQGHEL